MLKKELRKLLLGKRNQLSVDYRKEASKKIMETIETMKEYQQAQKVFVYINFDSEVETLDWIAEQLATKEIYVPKIIQKEMKLIRLHSIEDLTTGYFGILEPKSNEGYEGAVDFVITPSIAFDKMGYRLGYGKGYYDRYFTNSVYGVSVGVSFAELLQEAVIKEEHDQAVNYVVTENEVLTIN